ncbi:MAG: indole-3-glycerol phosphate synthase TrpC [Candidatus Polarisedimenticolia bacterium]
MRTGDLKGLAQAARIRAEADMGERSLADLEELIAVLPPVRPFGARLTRAAGPVPRVIAEMKPPSPDSGGTDRPYRPRQLALGFARVGAAALSVITEPDVHGGQLSHLLEARPAHLPILRSDCLITPYQVAQTRLAGADAVLLIAAVLEGPPLGIMLQAARRYGLEAMVEAHSPEDAARAFAEGASLVALTPEARAPGPAAPRPGTIAVAGAGGRQEVFHLVDSGYDAILVGDALMQADDPGDALWKLLERA